MVAASGELLSERVGVYNIGVEGAMLIGALAGFVVGQESGSVPLALVGAMIAGASGSLLFAIAAVVLRADMVVAGLALVFIGLGLTGVLGADYVREPARVTLSEWNIPILHEIPGLGRILFEQTPLTYVAFILPVAAWFLLYRTRHGLNLRAIGEDPGTADVSGVNVNGWRIFYICVAGSLAGLGGSYFTLGSIETWLPNVSAGQGFIALAVVIFARWEPIPLIFGALTFGVLGTVGNVAQALGTAIPTPVFSALPYIGTLAVVFITARIKRTSSGRQVWPAALGVPFFRAREGAEVIATDLRESELGSLADRLAGEGLYVRAHRLDVRDTASWRELISKLKRVDVLVNNAGVAAYAGVAEATDREWEAVLSVNQNGVFHGMRAVIPGMREAGSGAIVNVASVFGTGAVPGYFAYQASKAAVIQMTRAAAVEQAMAGIRVNSISPGLVITDMTADEPEEAVRANLDLTPMGRPGSPEEIAAGALFLASDDSSYVTGTNLVIDGGYLAA